MEIRDVVDGAVSKHELTFIEMVGILTEIIQGYGKYALRIERHGDSEKAAGIE